MKMLRTSWTLLIKLAKNSILSKVVTIRPDEHPWITCQIRNLIRKRKHTFRKYKKTQNLLFWEKFKMLPNQIVSNHIRPSKKYYFDKLEEILSKENVNSKVFWKTSKQVMGLQKSNHTIPKLKLNDKFAENDIDKANMLSDYFCSQSVVKNNNKILPQRTFKCNSRLNSITIAQQDVRDALNNLNVTKASGPDLISPCLLKERATILSKPLLYSIAHYFKVTFLLTGRMQMSLPFMKRQTNLCHQITDQYLF